MNESIFERKRKSEMLQQGKTKKLLMSDCAIFLSPHR